MPTDALRQIAHLSLEEIAQAQFEWSERTFGKGNGWKPKRATVSLARKRLGEPRKVGSRRDLIPWKNIRKEHLDSRYLKMLRAMSRSRERDALLSDTDQKWIDLLEDLLHGRGAELVIGYDWRIGFYLTDRLPSDIDIIRMPPEPLTLIAVAGD